MGLYIITNVWKGDMNVGDNFRFRLPCYDRDYLMKPGTIYLFFAVPIPDTTVYKQASCFDVKILGHEKLHPSSMPIINALVREMKHSKMR